LRSIEPSEPAFGGHTIPFGPRRQTPPGRPALIRRKASGAGMSQHCSMAAAGAP